MTRLEPIPRKPLARSVYEQVADRIIDGDFPAGKALPPERVLCAELGVSRTAVREALARLEQSGLIATRHGGQTTARDYLSTGGLDLLPLLVRDARGNLRREVMRAGAEMRAAIAPDIARLCAEHADAAVDRQLEDTLARMKETEELAELQALSMHFWHVVTAGSHNIAYQLALNSLRQAHEQIRGQIAKKMAREFRDFAGYVAIARAIRDRNARAAEAAARAHIGLGQ